MEIKKVKLDKLRPDDKNTRRHVERDIAELKRSLSKFGQHRALVVQRSTNKILIGNGMYQAMLDLGWKEADVYFVDDDDKTAVKRAIADNRASGIAEWDIDTLSGLMSESFNSGDFDIPGFSDDEVKILTSVKPQTEEPERYADYCGDERERTYNLYRLYEYDAERTAGKYNMPIVKACYGMPDALIPFNYVKSAVEGHKQELFTRYVHFFLDDYQFERIWRDPHRYIKLMGNFAGAIMPDFSTYENMPKAMKIWNMYRAKLISQAMQDYGMNVIPLIRGSEDFYLDGFEQGGVVAVSTVGIFADEEMQKKWKKRVSVALDKLKPDAVLLYGNNIGFDFGNIPVRNFKNTAFSRNR